MRSVRERENVPPSQQCKTTQPGPAGAQPPGGAWSRRQGGREGPGELFARVQDYLGADCLQVVSVDQTGGTVLASNSPGKPRLQAFNRAYATLVRVRPDVSPAFPAVGQVLRCPDRPTRPGWQPLRSSCSPGLGHGRNVPGVGAPRHGRAAADSDPSTRPPRRAGTSAPPACAMTCNASWGGRSELFMFWPCSRPTRSPSAFAWSWAACASAVRAAGPVGTRAAGMTPAGTGGARPVAGLSGAALKPWRRVSDGAQSGVDSRLMLAVLDVLPVASNSRRPHAQQAPPNSRCSPPS